MFNSIDAALFWSKVDKTPGQGPRGDCWAWTGAISAETGYGATSIDGRLVGAHRVAWSIENNREPAPGMLICHDCDNRPCCNPAHLWEGTYKDNARDMADKGRLGGTSALHALKTECPRGHPYDMVTTAKGRSFRGCRTCSRAHGREYMRRKRAGI